MRLVFNLPTTALDANDARALSVDEIRKYQEANYAVMQQASRSPYNELAYRNAMRSNAPPEKPLDERFAAFKARLAVAISKHSMIAT